MGNSNNTEKLIGLAGFDPAKRPPVTDDIIREVMGEVQKEREEQARVKARELVREAIALHEQKVKAEKEFKQLCDKIDKQLGKVLSQLNKGGQSAQAEGEPEPQAEEEK